MTLWIRTQGRKVGEMGGLAIFCTSLYGYFILRLLLSIEAFIDHVLHLEELVTAIFESSEPFDLEDVGAIPTWRVY